MKVSFEPLLWEDYPSINTPINAENLNRLEAGVAGLYEDMVEINAKLNGAFSEYVTDWLDEHVTPAGSAVIVDDSLTIEGAAADAKKTGDEISSLKEEISELSSIPTTVRQAMLTLFESAAYAETGLTDEIAVVESWAEEVTSLALDQTAISISGSGTVQLVATTVPAGKTVTWSSSDDTIATVSASGLVTGASNGAVTITAACGDKRATCAATVSGFATLVSISAVYTQSGTVNETDSLDSLKDDLVVTAHYSDSTTRTVTDYVLSGTLTVGTSTITVTYGGKTTTFNVTVTKCIFATQGNDFIARPTTATNRCSVRVKNRRVAPQSTLSVGCASGFAIWQYAIFSDNTASDNGTLGESEKNLHTKVTTDNGDNVLNDDIKNNVSPSQGGIRAWVEGGATTLHNTWPHNGITVGVIGFVIKKTDDSDITPQEAANAIVVTGHTPFG